MKQKDFKFNGPSRSNQMAKRRKTNLILNSLIVIVLVSIIMVSFLIFFSNGEEGSTNSDSQTIVSKENSQEKTKTVNGKENTENTVGEEEADSVADKDSFVEGISTSPESEDVVTGGGIDPNVKSTITNPDWKPVGTTQSGGHATVYDQNSIDWQEMMRAISYGTGLDRNNMTIWFLGSNGTENQSVSTITSKDQSVIYRVFIEWVDEQGWKPIKVEELYENNLR
jgi:hypothetical protein